MISDRGWARFSMSLGATGLRWIGKLNVPLYRASGGRLGAHVGKAPVLLLSTTGRRSGKKRTVPVLYLADSERLIVIGSNAGNPRTPAWSLNLQANPAAEIEIGRERRPVKARVAEGEERAKLWRSANQQYAGFDNYEEKTARNIALFILEPC